MANAKAQCSVCNKKTITFNCDGCSQRFCRTDLNKHLQSLGEQLTLIETDHDQFRQKLIDEKTDIKRHSSLQQIEEWEKYSIQIIQQTAEQYRQKLTNYINKVHNKLENYLNNLAKQIEDFREGSEFNEIDLEHLKQELEKLEKEPKKLLNITIRQESTSFVNKIFFKLAFSTDIKWKQDGLTIAGGNDQGNQLNQFHGPREICIDDDDQTLYIADWNNHRILEWKANATTGRIVAGGNGEGNQMNQLNKPTGVIIDNESDSLIIADRENRRVMRWSHRNNTTNGEIIVSDIDCRGLAMDKNGSLYVSDWKKNEVKRWNRGETTGTIVAGGNGKGNQLGQLNVPSYIFVNDDDTLYVSDRDNHRVVKWVKGAKEGIVVAGVDGQGSSLTQLSQPVGIIVDPFGQIYVADWNNHRVMRWCEGEKEGTVIVGGNGKGKEANQFWNPESLSFDRAGNLYVVDCGNNRIQKFAIDEGEDILFA